MFLFKKALGIIPLFILASKAQSSSCSLVCDQYGQELQINNNLQDVLTPGSYMTATVVGYMCGDPDYTLQCYNCGPGVVDAASQPLLDAWATVCLTAFNYNDETGAECWMSDLTSDCVALD